MKGGNINAIADLVFRDVPMINKPELLGKKSERLVSMKPQYNIVILSGVIGKFEETLVNQDISITPDWIPYIEFKHTPTQDGYKFFVLSFKEGIDINTLNSRGQTLLFLAARNCNKLMVDALVAMDARLLVKNSDGSLKKDSPEHIIGTNVDGSTILHGIAWGNVDKQGNSTKTYDEKVAFIQYILGRYPDTILLLFHKNLQKETIYDNLRIRHPDKM